MKETHEGDKDGDTKIRISGTKKNMMEALRR
jgi:hypothetical protein